MFPLMFVAITACLGTAAAVAPTSVALAVISAPFGGSLAALAAAFWLARRNGAADLRRPADLHGQTDAMVAALRGLDGPERAEPHRAHRQRASGEAGRGRHVA